MFWHCVGGVVIAGLLVVAWPQMVHQVTSDDGGWYSGARPECPSWIYEGRGTKDELDNTLPPCGE